LKIPWNTLQILSFCCISRSELGISRTWVEDTPWATSTWKVKPEAPALTSSST
jgi:hypothetical protein